MLARTLVLVVAMLAGCGALANATPGKKLSDAVLGLSEATRWGRLGTAANFVDPNFRTQFIENHRHWGGAIQLADSEVVHVEVASGHEQATALIAYQWYLAGAMTLQTTVIRQRWVLFEDRYGLVSEIIVRGDRRIFDPAASAAPAPGEDSVSLLGDPTDY